MISWLSLCVGTGIWVYQSTLVKWCNNRYSFRNEALSFLNWFWALTAITWYNIRQFSPQWLNLLVVDTEPQLLCWFRPHVTSMFHNPLTHPRFKFFDEHFGTNVESTWITPGDHLRPQRRTAEPKVEICAGDARVSCALRQSGFAGKEYDVPCLEVYARKSPVFPNKIKLGCIL